MLSGEAKVNRIK